MRVLACDVGFGTSDILLWDDDLGAENQTHLVVPSPTRVVAAEIRAATAVGVPVVFRGPLMGGGPCTAAMGDHVAAGLPFFAEAGAARTFSDDLDEVAAMGVTLVSDGEAADLARRGVAEVRSGDLRLDDLLAALRLLGEARPPEGYAIAVQDHGEAPRGMSDRVFRFEKLVELFSASRRLESLFFGRREIPTYFTRMRAAASCVPEDVPVVVGDTGPSALWGAALVAEETPFLVVNYGNGHVLMALLRGEEVHGVFEHHTGAVDRAAMAGYLERFSAGCLPGREVLEAGGHGVWPVSGPVDLARTPVIVTGPNRGRFAGIAPREVEAAPFGDMMLTGCFGLLQGYRARC